MSATLLETQVSPMPVIFPQEPAKVNIHTLPKDAEMITYCVDDDQITLSAWMPNDFHRIFQEREMSHDDFYYSHCDGCERNCHSFLSHYEDEDGDIDWEHEDLYGHCNVYEDGYHGQNCPEGYVMESQNVDFWLNNMVFQVKLSHIGNSSRFKVLGDSAFLRKGKVDDDGTILATSGLMASNVFGSEDNPEGICWGYNSRPNNLREVVTEYLNTPFNSDLTSVNAFEDNCNEISKMRYYYPLQDEKLVSKNADALLMIDAGENISAFFHLLCAGFKSLRDAPHIMFIPLKECEIEKNGKTFSGYQTVKDDLNRNWFVTFDGLLVGQV